MRWKRLSTGLLAGLVLASCGKGGDGVTPPPEDRAPSLSVTCSSPVELGAPSSSPYMTGDDNLVERLEVDHGDGNETILSINKKSAAGSIDHTYENAGTFTLSVVAEDNAGHRTPSSCSVVVNDAENLAPSYTAFTLPVTVVDDSTAAIALSVDAQDPEGEDLSVSCTGPINYAGSVPLDTTTHVQRLDADHALTETCTLTDGEHDVTDAQTATIPARVAYGTLIIDWIDLQSGRTPDTRSAVNDLEVIITQDGAEILRDTVDGTLNTTLPEGTYSLDFSHADMIPHLATYINANTEGFQLVNTTNTRWERVSGEYGGHVTPTGEQARVDVNKDAETHLQAYLHDKNILTADTLDYWFNDPDYSEGVTHRWEMDWTLRIDTLTQEWTREWNHNDFEYIPDLIDVLGTCNDMRVLKPVEMTVEYAQRPEGVEGWAGKLYMHKDSTQAWANESPASWNHHDDHLPNVWWGELSFKYGFGSGTIADGLYVFGLVGQDGQNPLVVGEDANTVALSPDLGDPLCNAVGAVYSGFVFKED